MTCREVRGPSRPTTEGESHDIGSRDLNTRSASEFSAANVSREFAGMFRQIRQRERLTALWGLRHDGTNGGSFWSLPGVSVVNETFVSAEAGLGLCRECRGVGHFTLQSRDRGDRSRVPCPVCHGTTLQPDSDADAARGCATAPPAFAFDALPSTAGRNSAHPR